MDVALWDDRIAVNVRHHFFAAQAVAPMMRDAGGGSIINLGSISAHIDLMDLPGYITAKAGIEGLTRTLAREYGPWHIRVNCIIPGWIMTEKQLDRVGDAGGRGVHRAQPVPARTSCTPTTWRGCCSGWRRTTPARARRRSGSWTEAGCERAANRSPSRCTVPRRGPVLGRDAAAGCCWSTCCAGAVVAVDADGDTAQPRARRRRRGASGPPRRRLRAGHRERGSCCWTPTSTRGAELPPVFTDPRIRMNDGGCDPQGRFYCGTMAYAETPGAGTLYRLDPDCRVHVVLRGVTISNGLQWSRDRRAPCSTTTRRPGGSTASTSTPPPAASPTGEPSPRSPAADPGRHGHRRGGRHLGRALGRQRGAPLRRHRHLDDRIELPVPR